MTYILHIRRQAGPDAAPYWQDFSYDGLPSDTVAAALLSLERRSPLTDTAGNEAEPVSWEHSCLVRKCGACAMLIDGKPRLACSAFFCDMKKTTVTLEPFHSFPLIRDLIVDRSLLHEAMKRLGIWLESAAQPSHWSQELRRQSARCLLCGCCLERCPNFTGTDDFIGAIAPVNAFRTLDAESAAPHRQTVETAYRRRYYEDCGQSLSCHDICPARIPVEALMAHANALAIWHKK